MLGALSPSIEVFLALRFLAGIGLGGCIPVDYAIVSEFSPRKQRGRVLAAMDGWWPVGTTLAGLSATLLVPVSGNWRWMLVLMILPALLLFWARRGVPESPLYLTRTGREAEARTVIDDLVARTGATPEPYAIPAPVVESGSTRAGRGGALAAAVDQLRRVWAFNPKVTGVAWALFISVMLVFGWASSSSRAITGFAPLLFGSVLWPVLGLPLTFALLGALVVGAVTYMWLCAPETAGRELDHITMDADAEKTTSPA